MAGETEISRVWMFPIKSDTFIVWTPGFTPLKTCSRSGAGPDTVSADAPSRDTRTSIPAKTLISTLTVEPSTSTFCSSHSTDAEGVGVLEVGTEVAGGEDGVGL